jgi:hypothetical protein
MALRYLKPEDCDRAGHHYGSFSCEPAPGGGNECVGMGMGGQFTDCKKCLKNCSNNLGGGGKGGGGGKPKPKTKPVGGAPSKSFLDSAAGKVTLGVGGVAIVALIIFLVMNMAKGGRSAFKTEPIYWRR